MSTLTSSEARKNLYSLIDQASDEHEPILITGKRHNAVLVSEDDWRSIQETLYLMRMPGMAKSIVDGMKTPASKMSKDLKW